MEKGRIDLVYESGDAVYYRLADKLDEEKILNKNLCQSETCEQAEKTFDSEQHWLAVWNKKTAERCYEGDMVEFDFSSTRFYENMRHGKDKLKNVRNINVTHLKRVSVK